MAYKKDADEREIQWAEIIGRYVDDHEVSAVWARVLAPIMELGGAKVLSGDVISGMARLGLQLVPLRADGAGAVSNEDYRHAVETAYARRDALTESRNCESCSGQWLRLTEPDVGWWHRSPRDRVTRNCRGDENE
jgi:hypothetical protein